MEKYLDRNFTGKGRKLDGELNAVFQACVFLLLVVFLFFVELK